MPITSRTALLGVLLAIAALAAPTSASAAATDPAPSSIELRLRRIATAIRERQGGATEVPRRGSDQLAYGFGNGGRGAFGNGRRGGFGNGARGGFVNVHPYYRGGGGFANGRGGGFVNARYGGGFVNGGPFRGGVFRNW